MESLSGARAEQHLLRRRLQFLLIFLHDTAKAAEMESSDFYSFPILASNTYVSTQKTKMKVYVSSRTQPELTYIYKVCADISTSLHSLPLC